MKKKNILMVAILALFSVLFVSCAAPDKESNEPNNGDKVETTTTDLAQGRLVVYTYNADIKVTKLKDALELIQKKVNDLGTNIYVETKEITETTAELVYRVKTEKYKEFIDELPNFGTVENQREKGQDITESYSIFLAKQTAANKELEALMALLDTHLGIAEIIQVQDRIKIVTEELEVINTTLNGYDSKVEYSTVILNLNEQTVKEKSKGFGAKIGNAITDSGKAFVSFLQVILLAIVYLVPFAAVIAVIVLIVYFYKKNKKRKEDNSEEDKNEENKQEDDKE